MINSSPGRVFLAGALFCLEGVDSRGAYGAAVSSRFVRHGLARLAVFEVAVSPARVAYGPLNMAVWLVFWQVNCDCSGVFLLSIKVFCGTFAKVTMKLGVPVNHAIDAQFNCSLVTLYSVVLVSIQSCGPSAIEQ